MKFAQIFDSKERLLDGDQQGNPLDNPPLARVGGLPTYLVETLIKGVVYGGQKVGRLAALLAPLSLNCCEPSPEEVQQSVQHDIRTAMDEVYRLPDPSCDEAEKTAKWALRTKGYEPTGEGHFSNLDATILMNRYEDRVTVTAEDLNGSLIIAKTAICKAENLQR